MRQPGPAQRPRLQLAVSASPHLRIQVKSPQLADCRRGKILRTVPRSQSSLQEAEEGACGRVSSLSDTTHGARLLQSEEVHRYDYPWVPLVTQIPLLRRSNGTWLYLCLPLGTAASSSGAIEAAVRTKFVVSYRHPELSGLDASRLCPCLCTSSSPRATASRIVAGVHVTKAIPSFHLSRILHAAGKIRGDQII